MAPALKSAMVCSDDDLMVDMVIAASQKKRSEALASFGRDLVPYFVPGASDLTEGAVNVNTDVDALRRSGGGILEIPQPVAAASRSSRKSQHNRNRQSPKKHHPNARTNGSPTRTVSPKPTVAHYPVVATHAASAAAPMLPRESPSSFFPAEAWAGPTYVNSPPPSSLPVPSFLKTQLKPAAKVPSVASLSAPSTPLKQAFAPISPDTVHAAVMGSMEPRVDAFSSHPMNPEVIEGTLKRLLQVA